MSSTKFFLILLVSALATLTVQAHHGHGHHRKNIKFYEIKKGNLRVNFTNYGARVVSLYTPDKFGNAEDIVLGYDSVDDYQNDKHSLGAIVGSVTYNYLDSHETNSLDDEKVDFSNAIWKVIKYEKSKKRPFITFQYNSLDEEQESHENQIIVTVTYLIEAKNKLKLKIHAETRHPLTLLNLAQNIYWNLGGHDSSGNILHDHLRVLASHYIKLDDDLVPTGKILPVEDTPYDFQQFHIIQNKFQQLKRKGYEVDYVVDHEGYRRSHDDVGLVAVVRDKKSGRVVKVWSDERVVHFSTGDDIRNVLGKGGVLYQRNAGLVLSAQRQPRSLDIDNDTYLVVNNHRPYYNQTTVFQFLTKK